MTVIRPNSVSGITSITAQANEINFFRSNGALAGLQLNGVNFNTTTGVSTFNNLDVGGVLTYQDVTNVDSIGIITARSTIDAQGSINLADSIIHTGDTDTKIAFTNNQIDLHAAGLSRFYINNSALYVKSGFPLAFLASSGATPNIKSGGTNNQDLLFTTGTGNPTRMQIKSDGNIEVSTTTDTNPRYLRFNSNRSNADDALGGIHGIWNGNSVAGINFKTGADTSNKDDGRIQFVTYTGGTAYGRMMIREDGKIGIGTDNPLQSLHVKQGSTTTPAMVEALGAKSHVRFQHNAGNSYTTTIGSKTLGANNVGLTFDTGYNGAVQRMTIDVNGNVGINTDLIGSQTWRNGKRLEIFGGSGNVTGELHLGAIRSDANESVGSINFFDNGQDTSHKQIALIEADKSGSTSNKRGGDLIFFTKPDNVASPTERFRIDKNGDIKFGTSAPGPATSSSPTMIRYFGKKVMQGTLTSTTTLSSGGSGTFELGKIWNADDTSIELFITVSRSDSSAYTTSYCKAFCQKVRGTGITDGYILRQDTAAAGFTFTSITSGGYSGTPSHGARVTVSGGVANQSYTLTCFYTAISKNDQYS